MTTHHIHPHYTTTLLVVMKISWMAETILGVVWTVLVTYIHVIHHRLILLILKSFQLTLMITICLRFNDPLYQHSALETLKHQWLSPSKHNWMTDTCWPGVLSVVWSICDLCSTTTMFLAASACFNQWS